MDNKNMYRRISRLARPYYPYDGPNSWQHIQEVRRHAVNMMRALEHRPLTAAEYAAVMLHDCTKHDLGGKNHGRTGADRAARLLAGVLSAREAAEASEAIRVHDDNCEQFPSVTAELLASADANPPDPDWVLNKSWCWGIRKGLDQQGRALNVLENVPRKYGTEGTFNIPGIYARYYGDAVRRAQEVYDSLTPEDVISRVLAYRKRYGIGPDELKVIHNA